MAKFYKVSFSKSSKEDLQSIFKTIKTSSKTSEIGHSVRKALLLSANNLKTFPEKYQIDEYYKDSNVRRYFVWNYRVVFEIIGIEVVILRIFGTYQSPLLFNK